MKPIPLGPQQNRLRPTSTSSQREAQAQGQDSVELGCQPQVLGSAKRLSHPVVAKPPTFSFAGISGPVDFELLTPSPQATPEQLKSLRECLEIHCQSGELHLKRSDLVTEDLDSRPVASLLLDGAGGLKALRAQASAALVSETFEKLSCLEFFHQVQMRLAIPPVTPEQRLELKSLLPEAKGADFKATQKLLPTDQAWPPLGSDPQAWAIAKTRCPDYRTAMVSSESAPIRLGLPGRVRSSGELGDAQVAQVLTDQLQPIGVEEIKALIGEYPQEQRGLAAVALETMTRAGNLACYGDILAAYQSNPKVKSIYAEGNGSLGDAFVYTASVKELFAKNPTISYGRKITNQSQLLLDRALLERLEREPNFVQEIVDHQAEILWAPALLEGINPFNAPELGDIKARLRGIVNRALRLRAESPQGISDEQASRQALGDPVRQRVQSVNPNLSTLLHEVHLTPASGDHRVERILAQLNGSLGLDSVEMEKVMKSVPSAWRPLAREIAVQNSEVQSHRGMALLARQQWERIGRFAQEKGIAQDDISFVVYACRKSYGIYTHIFKEANAEQVSSSQFFHVDDIDQAYQRCQGRPPLMVALDDFAGSGDSLLGSYFVRNEIRQVTGPEAEIVVAPSLASTQAYHQLARVIKKDPHTTMIAGRIFPAIEDSQVYQSYDQGYSEAVAAALGDDDGYGGLGSCVSLPYMGPDNNCSIFGRKMLNPFFVVNRTQTACKSTGFIKPLDGALLKPVVERELQRLREDLQALPKSSSLSLSFGLTLCRRLDELSQQAEVAGEISGLVNELEVLSQEIARRSGVSLSDPGAVANIALEDRPSYYCYLDTAKETRERLTSVKEAQMKSPFFSLTSGWRLTS